MSKVAGCLVILFLGCFSTVSFAEEVQVEFAGQEPRLSTGFFIGKNDKAFFVMTNHSFHEYEHWTPVSVQVRTQDKLIVLIPANRKVDNAGPNEYIDISVFPVNEPLPAPLFSYEQLADDADLDQILKTKSVLFANSRTAKKTVLMDNRYPIIDTQKMMGFRFIDAQPPIEPGDSGSILYAVINDQIRICGMIVKGDSRSGSAVDSIRIRQAMDMFHDN